MIESSSIPEQLDLNPESDYAFLRDEGIRYIQELAGKVWTDHNAHDPGITMLEQVCYALTDLGYRLNFSLSDLLTPRPDEKAPPGSGPETLYSQFHTARSILHNGALTEPDIRKVVIDCPGVQNAWVSRVIDPSDPVFIDCANNMLRTSHPAGDVAWPFLEPPATPQSRSCGEEDFQDYPEGWAYRKDWLNIRGLFRVDVLFTEQLLEGRRIEYYPSVKLNEDRIFAERIKLRLELPPFDEVKADFGFSDHTLRVSNLERLSESSRRYRGVFRFFVPGCEDEPPVYTLPYFLIIPDYSGAVEDEAQFAEQFRLALETQQEWLESYLGYLQGIEAGFTAVQECLDRHRNLCEEYLAIRMVHFEYLGFCLELDTLPESDLEAIMAQAYFQIAEFINPAVRFYSLQERLDAGLDPAEIFNGPALENGFIDDSELEAAVRPTEIHISDLYNILMDIPGVENVRSLDLTLYDNLGTPLERTDPWRLRLPNPVLRVPYMDLTRFAVTFFKNELPNFPSRNRFLDQLRDLQSVNRRRRLNSQDKDFILPEGRYRAPEDYHAMTNDFPLVFGIGREGLPGDASPQRVAQARQMKAYLIFFEQLMANFQAQLGHVRRLFSWQEADPRIPILESYKVNGLRFIEEIETLFLDYQGYLDQLHRLVESESLQLSRRNRFLDHLLGRFAEEMRNYSLLLYQRESQNGGEETSNMLTELIRDKARFLRDYPVISSERGLGYNLSQYPAWDQADNLSGFQQRLSRMLGINDVRRRNLAVYDFSVEREVNDEGEARYFWRFDLHLPLDDEWDWLVLESHSRYPSETEAEVALEPVLRDIHEACFCSYDAGDGPGIGILLPDNSGESCSDRCSNAQEQAVKAMEEDKPENFPYVLYTRVAIENAATRNQFLMPLTWYFKGKRACLPDHMQVFVKGSGKSWRFWFKVPVPDFWRPKDGPERPAPDWIMVRSVEVYPKKQDASDAVKAMLDEFQHLNPAPHRKDDRKFTLILPDGTILMESERLDSEAVRDERLVICEELWADVRYWDPNGLFVIEHLLLRPRMPEVGVEPVLPVCPECELEPFYSDYVVTKFKAAEDDSFDRDKKDSPDSPLVIEEIDFEVEAWELRHFPGLETIPRETLEGLNVRGEYIRIRNQSDAEVCLKDWSIWSLRGLQIYRFKPDVYVQPQDSVYLWSGRNAKALMACLPEGKHFLWMNRHLWNNKGDRAYLVDPDYRVISTAPRQSYLWMEDYADVPDAMLTLTVNTHDQWADLRNNSEKDLSLQHWFLLSITMQKIFRFPDTFVLKAGTKVRVWAGAEGDEHYNGKTDLFWSPKPVFRGLKSEVCLIRPNGLMSLNFEEDTQAIITMQAGDELKTKFSDSGLQVTELNVRDQYVIVTNQGGGKIELAGWSLRSVRSARIYHFPHAMSLEAGESLMVYSGIFPTAGEVVDRLYWQRGYRWEPEWDGAALVSSQKEVVHVRMSGNAEFESAASIGENSLTLELKAVEEEVIIRNTTDSQGAAGSTLDLSGWLLLSMTGLQMYRFPDDDKLEGDTDNLLKALEPGDQVTIRSGPSANMAPTNTVQNWQPRYIWNDSGDGAALIRPDGFVYLTEGEPKLEPDRPQTTRRVYPNDSMRIQALNLYDEYICIVNVSKEPLNLEDWMIVSLVKEAIFRFPKACILAPGDSVEVWSGPKTANREWGPGELFWTEQEIWDDEYSWAAIVNPEKRIVDYIGGPCRDWDREVAEAAENRILLRELDLEQDFVEVENCSERAVSLRNWFIMSYTRNQLYRFPGNYVLPAGEKVKVWSGPKADIHTDGNQNLFWTRDEVWEDGRDGALLVNPYSGIQDELLQMDLAYLNVQLGKTLSSIFTASPLRIIHFDPEQGFIELQNISPYLQSLTDWAIRSLRSGGHYRIRTDLKLAPGESLRIFSGPYAEENAREHLGLCWDSESHWSQDWDWGALVNPHEQISQIQPHGTPSWRPIELSEPEKLELILYPGTGEDGYIALVNTGTEEIYLDDWYILSLQNSMVFRLDNLREKDTLKRRADTDSYSLKPGEYYVITAADSPARTWVDNLLWAVFEWDGTNWEDLSQGICLIGPNARVYQKVPEHFYYPWSEPFPDEPLERGRRKGFRLKVLSQRPDCIELVNGNPFPLALRGWMLWSLTGLQVFEFPAHLVLEPGQSVTIWSGPNAEKQRADHEALGGLHLYWSNLYMWNNRGDRVLVVNPQRQVVTFSEANCYKGGEEILSLPPDAVIIESIDLEREVVAITNTLKEESISLRDWYLLSMSGLQLYPFEEDCVIEGGQTLYILSGKDAPERAKEANKDLPGRDRYYAWVEDRRLWNNLGDGARLFNPLGELVSELVVSARPRLVTQPGITLKAGLLKGWRDSNPSFEITAFSLEGQYLEIKNISGGEADLQNWQIRSLGRRQTMKIGAQWTVGKDQTVRIWTGKKENMATPPDDEMVFFELDKKPRFLEGGDWAVLLDPRMRVASVFQQVPVAYDAPDQEELITMVLDGDAEFVELKNDGDTTVPLDGWHVMSLTNLELFRFPADASLAPGDSLKVLSGPAARKAGQDDPYYWSGRHLFNDQGDGAVLVRPDGLVLQKQDDSFFMQRMGIFRRDINGPVRSDFARIEFLGLEADTIVIGNVTDEVIDLTGWMIWSLVGNQVFRFPNGFSLGPWDVVRVISGHDADERVAEEPNALKWTRQYVWNNLGDRALLIDPNGFLADQTGKGCCERGSDCEEVKRGEVCIEKLDLEADMVRVTNYTDRAISLKNWLILSDTALQMYRFPDAFILRPRRSVNVWSGRGADEKADGIDNLFWTRRYVWNNKGDQAILINCEGLVTCDPFCRDKYYFRVNRIDGPLVLMSEEFDSREARDAAHYDLFRYGNRYEYFHMQEDSGRFRLETKTVADTGEVIASAPLDLFKDSDAGEAEIANLISFFSEFNWAEPVDTIQDWERQVEQARQEYEAWRAEVPCHAEFDPYSFRISVVLPGYVNALSGPDFRSFAEEKIRLETPAHIHARICWIGRWQMRQLERAYREWLQALHLYRLGRRGSTRVQLKYTGTHPINLWIYCDPERKVLVKYFEGLEPDSPAFWLDSRESDEPLFGSHLYLSYSIPGVQDRDYEFPLKNCCSHPLGDFILLACDPFYRVQVAALIDIMSRFRNVSPGGSRLFDCETSSERSNDTVILNYSSFGT